MLFLRVVLILLLSSTQVFAVGPDPAKDWRTLTTDHFRIHFPAEARASAVIVGEIAEDVHPRITQALEWEPKTPTEIVLFADIDVANGFATPLPFNRSGIFLAPPDQGELLQNEDWLRLVIRHEYVHIVHLDKVAGAPSVLRSIFGRQFWLFPNALQPDWFVEGLAVWQESDPAQKIGRWKNSAFDALMRVEVLSGIKSLREINASGRGLPLNRAYLYGAYFFDFLSERYGANAPWEMVRDYSRRIIPFRVHNAPVSATGKQMDVLWDEYRSWLEQRFGAQLLALTGPAPAAGEVVAHDFSISDPAPGDDGSAYFVRGDGLTRPRIVRRTADGREEALRDVYWNARLAAGPNGALLAVMNDIVGNYDFLGDLHVYTPQDGWTQLTHGARLRLAAFDPAGKGFVAVLANDTGLAIVRLDERGRVAATLSTLAAGQAVSGLDVSPDGREVAWTQNRERRWQLMTVSGTAAPRVQIDDAAIKHSPRYSADGAELLLVADYGTVANVWALNPGRDRLTRQTATHTAVTGLASPRRGGLLTVELGVGGDTLRRLPVTAAGFESRPVATASASGSAAAAGAPIAGGAQATTAATPAAAPEPSDRPYRALPSLLPRAWFPNLLLADGAIGVGVQLFGQDAVGWHVYNLSALYETTQDELLGAFAYAYDDRHFLSWRRDMTVRATTETDDETDIVAYSIKQKAQWLSLLPYEKLSYRLALGLGAALSQETFTVVEGTRSTLVDERLAALVLRYDSRTQQVRSEGPNQGQQATLFVESYDAFSNSDYTGEVLRFDWRGFLPAGKTVFALNYREGRADDRAKGFTLGGRSIAADAPVIELGERDYDLRAYGSGIASGQRVRVGSLEWRFPLADIDRHLMVPPVGLNRLSANLFYEAGAAWNRDTRPDYLRAVGVEGLAEVRLGYLLPLQARLGVARGLDADRPTRAYLTLGRAF